MHPMRPVDASQLRSPRRSAEVRVQQILLTLGALPFVVLAIVGAPMWGWGVALAGDLVVVCTTDALLRRRCVPGSRPVQLEP